MGVLDTTYTFTATDIVTSAKLNNVIDQTTFTSSAFSNTTLAINSSGQLRVNTSGITQLELADNSVITAKILDANVTQAKLAVNTVGNGPMFLAGKVNSQSVSGTFQTITDISNEVYDTSNSYNTSTSTFTVPIAGYYLLMGLVTTQTAAQNLIAHITVNGNDTIGGEQVSATTLRASVSGIRFLGVGDLVQLKASVTGTVLINGATFEGCLIRSA